MHRLILLIVLVILSTTKLPVRKKQTPARLYAQSASIPPHVRRYAALLVLGNQLHHLERILRVVCSLLVHWLPIGSSPSYFILNVLQLTITSVRLLVDNESKITQEDARSTKLRQT